MRQLVKALDNPILKVLMTIILCLMMPGTHRALPTCFKYPRYFVSNFTSNFILSMDMHFPTDLLIYVGHSNDKKLNGNTLCSECAIPFVAAMSVTDPTFKWTLAAVQWASQAFSDVEISDDGAKAVVAGFDYHGQNEMIVWVLNAATGSIIS